MTKGFKQLGQAIFSSAVAAFVVGAVGCEPAFLKPTTAEAGPDSPGDLSPTGGAGSATDAGSGGSGVGGSNGVGGSSAGGSGAGESGVGGSNHVGGSGAGGSGAAADGGTGGVGGSQGDGGFDSLTGSACSTRPSSLVAWWRGEGNARDALNGSDGTWIGAAQYGLGKAGQAFQFQGSQAVAVTSSGRLYPQGSFSIEAWFLTVSSAEQVIVSLYDCGGPSCVAGKSTSAYLLSISGGYASFSVRDADPGLTFPNISSGIAAQGGAWHHVVAVRDLIHDELLIYQDGSLAAQGTFDPGADGPLLASDDPTEANPFVIGAVTNPGAAGYNRYFIGLIDEVAYYDAALGPDDVVRLFGAGGAGKCP